MKWILFLLVVCPIVVNAQRFTVSGYIRDAANGESLIGSAVINRKTLQGTTANVHGFYSITLPRDSVHLVYSYVGYAPFLLKFNLTRDTAVDVTLNNANQLDEIIIDATRAEPIHEASQMGAVNIPVEQIKALPALLGQVDVLKVLQLMPGVKSSEGSTGLYVRAGGPDQNLILLDGVFRISVTLYNQGEEYARFVDDRGLQHDLKGYPFAQPVTVYSNVSNRNGIFAIKTASSAGFNVKRRTLP